MPRPSNPKSSRVPAGPRASRWLAGHKPAGESPGATPHAEGSPLDTWLQSTIARYNGGISPASADGAMLDWLVHLSMSPAKMLELDTLALRQWHRLLQFSLHANARDCPPCIEPLPQDRRFRDDAWQRWPYNVAAQSFLLAQQWVHAATGNVPGVSAHHSDMVTFAARQVLDMLAPSNSPLSNPVVANATLHEGGFNLLRGAAHLADDTARALAHRAPYGADAFPVGERVAVTPGRVVMRNELMELIQYTPTTAKVHPEPILIVPAWIMKYYILDLQPHNSLVRFLVAQGHTVFVVSWKNPVAADHDLGMDDYLRLGVLAALPAIAAIVPGRKVHATGYCLGGTLLAIAAAHLAKAGSDALASMTLLAAQVDFTEPGELSLFIDESQISFLEHIMRAQGYLDTTQMAGAFTLLRSNDLFWSYRIRNYLLGHREPPSDLMAWNADGTRLPCRMHSEYLRSLFLHNELAAGKYQVEGRAVALSDIRVPVFAVGTTYDHVAPWRSVYKIHLLTDAEVTFVLASGGHNVGIVAAPDDDAREYRLATRQRHATYQDPDTWQSSAAVHAGSWWIAWQKWLARHSGPRGKPPSMGAPQAGYKPLARAPGEYVFGE